MFLYFLFFFILCSVFFFFFFFFSSRRRHTRCGRDWSSDVCSSDLGNPECFSHGVFVAVGDVLRGSALGWLILIGQHLFDPGFFFGAECRFLLALFARAHYHASHNQQAANHGNGREGPEENRALVDRRFVLHKFAKTVHQGADDFIVGSAALHHPVHLVPHILGYGSIGISDILVLALGAAQLGNQVLVTLLFSPGIEVVDLHHLGPER